uniref:Uncharacterized protein n=2 Tax=Lysobacteraceae TaxID=32033 RepID=A0A0A0QXF3_STEMA|nr:hypothetical protein [Stenotrophomonas maltophilia]
MMTAYMGKTHRSHALHGIWRTFTYKGGLLMHGDGTLFPCSSSVWTGVISHSELHGFCYGMAIHDNTAKPWSQKLHFPDHQCQWAGIGPWLAGEGVLPSPPAGVSAKKVEILYPLGPLLGKPLGVISPDAPVEKGRDSLVTMPSNLIFALHQAKKVEILSPSIPLCTKPFGTKLAAHAAQKVEILFRATERGLFDPSPQPDGRDSWQPELLGMQVFRGASTHEP